MLKLLLLLNAQGVVNATPETPPRSNLEQELHQMMDQHTIQKMCTPLSRIVKAWHAIPTDKPRPSLAITHGKTLSASDNLNTQLQNLTKAIQSIMQKVQRMAYDLNAFKAQENMRHMTSRVRQMHAPLTTILSTWRKEHAAKGDNRSPMAVYAENPLPVRTPTDNLETIFKNISKSIRIIQEVISKCKADNKDNQMMRSPAIVAFKKAVTDEGVDPATLYLNTWPTLTADLKPYANEVMLSVLQDAPLSPSARISALNRSLQILYPNLTPAQKDKATEMGLKALEETEPRNTRDLWSLYKTIEPHLNPEQKARAHDAVINRVDRYSSSSTGDIGTIYRALYASLTDAQKVRIHTILIRMMPGYGGQEVYNLIAPNLAQAQAEKERVHDVIINTILATRNDASWARFYYDLIYANLTAAQKIRANDAMITVLERDDIGVTDSKALYDKIWPALTDAQKISAHNAIINRVDRDRHTLDTRDIGTIYRAIYASLTDEQKVRIHYILIENLEGPNINPLYAEAIYTMIYPNLSPAHKIRMNDVMLRILGAANITTANARTVYERIYPHLTDVQKTTAIRHMTTILRRIPHGERAAFLAVFEAHLTPAVRNALRREIAPPRAVFAPRQAGGWQAQQPVAHRRAGICMEVHDYAERYWQDAISKLNELTQNQPLMPLDAARNLVEQHIRSDLIQTDKDGVVLRDATDTEQAAALFALNCVMESGEQFAELFRQNLPKVVALLNNDRADWIVGGAAGDGTLTNRWRMWLYGSLYDSGKAYDWSTPNRAVSCIKGIAERLLSSLKDINTHFRSVFHEDPKAAFGVYLSDAAAALQRDPAFAAKNNTDQTSAFADMLMERIQNYVRLSAEGKTVDERNITVDQVFDKYQDTIDATRDMFIDEEEGAA